MKKITFRELLNLMYDDNAPERIKYNGGLYQKYGNVDYCNKNRRLLSSVIGEDRSLESMVQGKVITIYYEEILTKIEKEYLSNIIKPFKKYISEIKKIPVEGQERIIIRYHDYLNTDGNTYGILLPTFKQGTMYKGMELWKEYTVEELEL